MKHFILVLITMGLSAMVRGQTTEVFRMVGNGSWSAVNDSTYTATVVFYADLTGKGYLATGITTSYRLFSSAGFVYRVTGVSGQTFSTATLTVVEYGLANGPPTGQTMVYDPQGRESVPQNPFGSTGATAQIQAAIDTYNASLLPDTYDGVTTGGTYDSINKEIDFTVAEAPDFSVDVSALVEYSVLSSTTINEGASLIGVEDVADNFTSTDLESVLNEIMTTLNDPLYGPYKNHAEAIADGRVSGDRYYVAFGSTMFTANTIVRLP